MAEVMQILVGLCVSLLAVALLHAHSHIYGWQGYTLKSQCSRFLDDPDHALRTLLGCIQSLLSMFLPISNTPSKHMLFVYLLPLSIQVATLSLISSHPSRAFLTLSSKTPNFLTVL
ncbi:hypothetical protein AcW1_010393 [Taiwanofungus camphoratus]|nr:hypothetical protein AcW1_010393 [Antrodia cinnamomea]